MNEAPAPFGVLLKRRREAAGLTQEALAELAGVSVRGISDLERGVARTPRSVTLGLLSQALRLSGADRAQFEAAAHRLRPGSAVRSTAGLGVDTAVPLVGRLRELTLLERHLTGGESTVLILGGEPGIGKSRLLQEAVRYGEERGMAVLIGGCHRHGGQESFAPILTAIRAYYSHLTPAQRKESLRGCAWLVRLLPELAEGPIESLPAWTLSPEQERRLMFQAVARFLSNTAGTAGTLLVLDDVHWIGPDAIELLAFLVRSIPDTPLRLLAAYRDAEASPIEPLDTLLADLAHAGLVRYCRVGPLSSVDCEGLLLAVLKQSGDGERDLRERIIRRTGGVPFFVLSCAQTLGTTAESRAWDESVPWSVVQSVRQRVTALPQAAQEVLGAAAVLGRDLRPALLGAIAALPEHSVIAALDIACHTRLLEEDDTAYRFAHDIIREVVETDLGLARRRVLHLRAAEALEHTTGKLQVELLAYHYAHSEAREQAARCLEAAGDHAASRMAHAAAESAYREALLRLDQPMESQDAAQVRDKLGVVLETSGRWDEALAEFEQAAEAYLASGTMELLGRVLGRIGYVHGKRGTVEEGVARLQPLVTTLRAAGALDGLVALQTALAPLFFQCGAYTAARLAGEEAAALARQLGDERLRAAAERGHGLALVSVGQIEQGLQALEEAGRIAEKIGDLATLCMVLSDMAAYHGCAGNFARARMLSERVLALAEQLGDPYRITSALLACGGIEVTIGAWQQARQRCEAVIALQRDTGTSWEYPYAMAWRGWLNLLEGAWDEATRDLEQAIAIAARSKDLQCLRCTHPLLAERDLVEGRPADAVARLIPLLDRPGMGEEWGVLLVLPALAWAHLELGEIQEAERHVTEAVKRARTQGLRQQLVEALRVQAMIAMRSGAWDAAEECLQEGLAMAREMDYPYGEARLLQLYGELQVTRNPAEPMRERLEAALAIFERLNARKDIERTKQVLAAVPVPTESPNGRREIAAPGKGRDGRRNSRRADL